LMDICPPSRAAAITAFSTCVSAASLTDWNI
jgi:hypothetical protein